MRFLLIFFILIACHTEYVSAQIDSAKGIDIIAYAETYYSYDFGRPQNHKRPSFMYSYNRHNEVNINLGFLKINYLKNKVRANLALMAGTYSNANLASEPGVLKNIFEANVGHEFAKNIWVDAGVFVSHIGFESAIGKDCWTLTRSIVADNSPYYESGVKLSYISSDEKWMLSGLFLNGWQRITRIDGNNTPAFGHQLVYKPNEKLILNSSSFIGNNMPDSTRRMRYYHDLYAIIKFNENLSLITCFDIGIQQKSKGSSAYDLWYSPVLVVKYGFNEKSGIAVRGEYYSDKNEVVVSTGTPFGFQNWGYSLNYDYNINKHIVWRIEARGFKSPNEIFSLKGKPVKSNYCLTSAFAIAF